MVYKKVKGKKKSQKKEYLVQVWVDETLLNQLERTAEKYSLNKSILVRQALKQFLEKL